MTNTIKKRVIHELDNFPENKIDSLLDYILFLKYEDQIKIPNEITEQTFKDTDKGKNLIKCKDANDMFTRLGI